MNTKLYVLCEREGPVRYVGKTVKKLEKRLWEHLWRAKRVTGSHKESWIRSENFQVEIHLVDEVEGDGFQQEVELIAGLRALGVRLVNGTDGGEGLSGWTHSEETKAKIAAAHTGMSHSPEARARIGNIWRGKKLSAEHRAKMSASRTGKVFSAETRAKLSAAKVGKPMSLVARLRMSAAHLGMLIERSAS